MKTLKDKPAPKEGEDKPSEDLDREFEAQCQNENCKQTIFENFIDIGRNVRNVIESFEFQSENGIENFPKKIASLTKNYKDNIKLKCEFCDA